MKVRQIEENNLGKLMTVDDWDGRQYLDFESKKYGIITGVDSSHCSCFIHSKLKYFIVEEIFIDKIEATA